MSGGTAAEPRRRLPWLMARVRLSMTRTNGMMPLVLPLRPTGSPAAGAAPPPAAAAQAARAEGEGEAVHDAHERDDAAGLAVEADRLADAAHRAPISADAAAARGQPDILVPGVDDARSGER